MGMLRISQNRLIEGVNLLREALERAERILGPDDQRTLWIELNLGVGLLSTSGAGEAEPHFRRAYDGMLALFGPDHHNTIKCQNNLANCLRLQHRFAEAEPLLRGTLDSMRRLAGDRHPDTLGALNTYGQLLLSRRGPGDFEQADLIFAQLVEGCRSALGPDHGETIAALYILGEVRRARGHYAEAEPPLREVIDRLTAMGSAMAPQAIMARLELGRALTSLGRHAEAETQLLEAVRVLQSSGHGGGRANTGRGPGVQDLIDLYSAWDHAEPGKGYDAKVAEWKLQMSPKPKRQGDQPPNTPPR